MESSSSFLPIVGSCRVAVLLCRAQEGQRQRALTGRCVEMRGTDRGRGRWAEWRGDKYRTRAARNLLCLGTREPTVRPVGAIAYTRWPVVPAINDCAVLRAQLECPQRRLRRELYQTKARPVRNSWKQRLNIEGEASRSQQDHVPLAILMRCALMAASIRGMLLSAGFGRWEGHRAMSTTVCPQSRKTAKPRTEMKHNVMDATAEYQAAVENPSTSAPHSISSSR